MSLVVARVDGPHLFVISDTHLTDPLRTERVRPLEGIIKTRIVTDTLCVSFAGSVYWAEVGLREVDSLAAVPNPLEQVVDILLGVHKDSSGATKFLIAAADSEPALIEIKDRAAKAVPASWLGSAEAFERFQGVATGALSPPVRPVNTVAFEAFRIPEAVSGHVSDLYARLLSAMRFVIEDRSLPEVGGFVVPVGLHKGRFEYMDYATVLTHPIRFDQMPEKLVVPFGTAEQGGYAFALMSERTSSTRGLGVYALQGRYGVAFIPEAGALKPVALRNVSPLEFEEAVATTLGINLGCMYTQPEEYCARAISLSNGGNLDGALAEAEKAVARSNNIPAGYRCRGIIRAKRGELQAALNDFTDALALEPAHPATLDNRGLVFARLARLEDAYDDFSQAIRVAPAYSRVYRHRALAARKLGRVDEALADEETAREIADADGAA